ncbi:MAG: CHAT domain-containing protein, partial [Nitrospirae bacterium]|nr:CHAT domain-containing protein [Magnetococcales bacterium]
AIREKALGPEHPDVAQSLNNLAELYRVQGHYAQAEPLYKRSLAIREKALGPEHPEVALNLNDLAVLYKTQGQYAQAELLYKRSLAIYEKALGPEHPNVAASLKNVADLYSTQGQYAQAEPLYKRSLAIWEKALGPEHPDVATSLNNLAELYRTQGHYAQAELLYKRSLGIWEKALGPEHPDVAQSLNNLASLYNNQGHYAQAEPLHKRSLGIWEKALGPEHPNVAISLNNLAVLYQVQGHYSQAEPFFKRSLGIWEKALGPEHPDVAQSLNNLALLYYTQGQYAQAEPLYKRSLAIKEKALGPEHSDVALSLNNLAELYRTQGQYAQAEPLYKRSLAIWEKALGLEHPNVAQSLNNLAGLYDTQGQYAQAEPLYKRALAIREKALGPEHPDVATSLNNLAVLYQAQGQYQKALPLFKRGFRATNFFLERVIWGAGDKTRQSYMRQEDNTINTYLSLLSAMDNDETANEASFYSLSRKGFLLRIASEVNAIARSGEHPALKEKAEALGTLRKALAQLLFSGSDQKNRIATLNKAVYDLESDLGSKVQALGRAKAEVNPDKVLKALQPGQVLVDLLVFHERDLKSLEYKNWQIIAIVTDPQGEPKIRMVKIGAMDPLAEQIKSYREAMEEFNAGKSMDMLAKKIYASLWKPLQSLLENKETVYLIPDGVLHLLPFKALMDEQGRYLGQTTRLVTLSSARDVVLPPLTGDATAPIVVAGPDYSVGLTTEKASANRGTRTGGIRLSDIYFAPLPGALTEGKTIAEKMGQQGTEPVLMTKAEATEKRVSGVKAPRILHLATHGFFLDTMVKESEDDTVPLPEEKGRSAVPMMESIDRGKKPQGGLVSVDTMSRAGLAFAGANAGVQGIGNAEGTDGILTAGEAVNLDLGGTDLVMLSACQTGVGDVRNGEGVYGLQRAFQEAGAKAVLSTLWSISDGGSMVFMNAFYDRFLKGMPPQKALQETQDEFIKSEKWHHPYFWAPFVMVGKGGE